jgi:hypothetical protein
MAPQRLEKIESAPGNGRVSEASKPQDLVCGRAADRALRLTRREAAQELRSWRNCQAVVSPNCHRFVETDRGRLIVRDGRRRI